MTPLLELRDLAVTLDTPRATVAAVNGVSLTIDRGEIVGIVGESGAGKTMVARAITALLPSNAHATGQVLFDGHDVLQMSGERLRRHRGEGAAMCFQSPRRALAPTRTVGRQIGDRLRAHQEHVPAGTTRLGLLESVGIRDARRRLDAYPHELSGGMAQRVMISLALACYPALVVADEPTTGLDVTLTRGILDLLASTVADADRAVVVISHDIAAIARICRRVVVMYGGIVVEQGPAASVLTSPAHPYTAALLEAVPDIERGLQQALPGAMPQFEEPPRACPFAPRCPLAEERCLEGVPAMRELGESWRAACIHAGETGVGGAAPSSAAVRIPGQGQEAAAEPLLEVRGLQVVYGSRFGRGGHRALRGVDVRVRPGETVGVVGESGSGKTTLARAMLGLVQPSSGEVRFHGQTLARLSRSELHRLRRGMQMVFQDPIDTLDPRRSVRQTLRDSLRLLDLDDRAADARILETLQHVALSPTILERRRNELSGGQAQRVGIARALIVDPELIVFDEPTSALDVTVQAQILELVQSLLEERSRAHVYVSHDLATVRNVADRVFVMYLGTVVEEGSAAAVFSSPLHPYTRALFAEIPTLGAGGRPAASDVQLRRDLEEHGDVRGCVLARRCPFATERCTEEPQPLVEYAPDHFAACWRVPEIT